ncbi:MAG: hypothetical protein JXR77_03770 [Lentisphaeria bacterium]|nr:hypothetical protein [Lentisphaeria bacterium]
MSVTADSIRAARWPGALWRQAGPATLTALGLVAAAVVLQVLGRAYLQVFAMNVSMVTFALTLTIYRRYRDWRVLPLALLFFWNTFQQTVMALAENAAARPPAWISWLSAMPLVAPTVLGFAAVVFLWRVFEVQFDLQRREEQLAERMRQSQKLESLGIMAGGIAHDFSNLLTTILGNAALIDMRAGEDADTAECARAITAAAERAATISRQMLAYSGCGKFRVEQTTLPRLVQDCRALLEAYVPGGTSLRIETEGDGPVITGDVSQLEQLLVNLVTNAAEAVTGKGTIVVRTGVLDADEVLLANGANTDPLPPGRYAELRVEDDGEGMDEATAARVFDPFFSTRAVGRGMGLAAALGIVRGHHGTIRVGSTPGRGTSVQVLLPESSVDVPDGAES